MTLWRYLSYEWSCDHPGCVAGTESFLPREDEPLKKAWARRAARRLGWWLDDATDEALCPKHRPDKDTP